MTSGGLAIELGENMTKVTSTGSAEGYQTPFITYLYRSWFPRYRWVLKSTPPPTAPRRGLTYQFIKLEWRKQYHCKNQGSFEWGLYQNMGENSFDCIHGFGNGFGAQAEAATMIWSRTPSQKKLLKIRLELGSSRDWIESQLIKLARSRGRGETSKTEASPRLFRK